MTPPQEDYAERRKEREVGGYKTYFEARDRLLLDGAKPIDSVDATSLRPGTHNVEVVNVEWDSIRGPRHNVGRGEGRMEGDVRAELSELRVVFGAGGRFIDCRPRPYGRLFDELRRAASWGVGRDPTDLLGRTVRITVVPRQGVVDVWRATTGEFLVLYYGGGLRGVYSKSADAMADAREQNGPDWTPTMVVRVEPSHG